MLEKLQKIEERFHSLTESLSDPAVIGNMDKLRDVSKERSKLEPIIEKFSEYSTAEKHFQEATEMLDCGDPELKEMARQEIDELKPKLTSLMEELKILLIPKDPDDDKDVFLEVRAGTGGDEAGLFAYDLFRMYQKYSDSMGWSFNVVELHETGPGVIKEVVVEVTGDEVYGKLKYESGVHRVQRVPETETQGRVHTSAATVVVLPQSEANDIQIETKDLRIETYRSSGAGGQHVNTTDSAVRIIHIPTNTVVTCQNERSQIKNRATAMKVLASRLQEVEHARHQEEQSKNRKSQVGTGDRSAKIRTYNYQQSRMSDHRIGLTLYRLDSIMNGDIGEIIEALTLADRAEKLKGESV